MVATQTKTRTSTTPSICHLCLSISLRTMVRIAPMATSISGQFPWMRPMQTVNHSITNTVSMGICRHNGLIIYWQAVTRLSRIKDCSFWVEVHSLRAADTLHIHLDQILDRGNLWSRASVRWWTWTCSECHMQELMYVDISDHKEMMRCALGGYN